MKAKRRTLTPAKEILLGFFPGRELELATFLMRHTYFISPDRIRQRLNDKGGAVRYPNCVRTLNEHHKGKQRGSESVLSNGRIVTVRDNTKARLAFGSFSGLRMNGTHDDTVRGYHVAHIWGNVHDPEYFTAAWNICLMPGFLKLFTEKQDCIPGLQEVLQQAAFNLYFKDRAIGLDLPAHVSDPKLHLNFEIIVSDAGNGARPFGSDAKLDRNVDFSKIVINLL